MIYCSMNKKLGMGQMIDKSIDDVKLRCVFWMYSVHADAGLWAEVLHDKWLMLDYEQRG